MSTHKSTSFFNLDYDLRIEPLTAGGFLLTQSYYDPTAEKDHEGETIYYNYKRAFSTSGDLLSFLEEAFGYPIARARRVDNVHPLPT